MAHPDNRHDLGDKSVGEPLRKRRRTDAESNVKTGTGISNDRCSCNRCREDIPFHISRMDDMFAFIESSSREGLTIDTNCLRRYPLEKCDHIYRQFGPMVVNLTVSKVTEQNLEALSTYFKNTRTLHLERILIKDLNLGEVFPNLLNIKFTECAIGYDLMDNILAVANSKLHFHFNKSIIANSYAKFPWSDGKNIPKHLKPRPRITDDTNNLTDHKTLLEFKRPIGLKNFTHLTLERVFCTDKSVYLNGTESLRIVNCDKSVTMSTLKDEGTYWRLQCLSLETTASIRDFVKNVPRLGLVSLEVLTLSHLPTSLSWLRQLDMLKQLRILTPILTCQEVTLQEALAAMKNEINVEYEVSPTPEVDQILIVLNEDCLREILSYLHLDDMFNLALTDCRFRKLISSIDLSSFGICVRIDHEFLWRHSLRQQLIGYKTLGHSLSRLKLECSERNFTTLAPCFPRLRILNLGETDWDWTDQLIEAFPTVGALELGRLENPVPTGNLMKLFRKLQPTLRVLYGSNEANDLNIIQNYQNLRELRISTSSLNINMAEFWKHNQCLEGLHLLHDIDDLPDNENQDRNWKEIAGLKNLYVLEISEVSYSYSRGKEYDPLPAMKYVKELYVDGLETEMVRRILECMGGQLQFLKMSDSKRLRRWEQPPLDELFELISSFQNLTRVEWLGDITLEQLIRLMVELPVLSVVEINTQEEFVFEDLQKFLAAANRVLYLNGVKYP